MVPLLFRDGNGGLTGTGAWIGWSSSEAEDEFRRSKDGGSSAWLSSILMWCWGFGLCARAVLMQDDEDNGDAVRDARQGRTQTLGSEESKQREERKAEMLTRR